MAMDAAALAKTIDHTFLGAAGDADAIGKLCREAKECGFASVCVNPCEVKRAAELLKGSGVRTCTVIGFPLGQSSTLVKGLEAAYAIGDGADELDFVVNQRLLKYDAEACREELAKLIAICRKVPGPVSRPAPVTKLILECCNLTEGEIVRGCRLAQEAGFDFVKTSTGFGRSGARVEDVRLMRETVGPEMGVKAAGGIRDRETALAMLAAGANRLGTSAGVQIVAG